MSDKKLKFEFRYCTGQYEYINAEGEFTVDEALEMRKILDIAFKAESTSKSITVDTSPPVESNEFTLKCELCQSTELWDNRNKKLSPKSPDFTCKNCRGVYWESSLQWKPGLKK